MHVFIYVKYPTCLLTFFSRKILIQFPLFTKNNYEPIKYSLLIYFSSPFFPTDEWKADSFLELNARLTWIIKYKIFQRMRHIKSIGLYRYHCFVSIRRRQQHNRRPNTHLWYTRCEPSEIAYHRYAHTHKSFLASVAITNNKTYWNSNFSAHLSSFYLLITLQMRPALSLYPLNSIARRRECRMSKWSDFPAMHIRHHLREETI